MSTRPQLSEAFSNLCASLRQLAQTTSSYTSERLDQVDTAIEGESRRRLWVLLSACALLLWLNIGLLFAGLAILIAFWDTNRVIASASVAASFLALAALAGWTLARQWQRRHSILEGLVQLLALFLVRRR
jgi:uncharacterized membrane protein YqjE